MIKTLICSINLLLACCFGQSTNSNGSLTNYSYDPDSPNSPANWEEFAPQCGGHSQSPINIQIKRTQKFSYKVAEIKGTKWAEKPTAINVTNIAKTIQFVFMYADQSKPNILVNGVHFELAQLHFHFGLNRQAGSEHYLNNRAYAMEGHAVFYNRKYGNLTNALTYSDGLTVIGRFFDETHLFCFNPIEIDFKFLQNVRNPNESYIINGLANVFSVEDIMGPLSMPYVMYQGSLTIPGCNEVVAWRVGVKPLKISNQNMIQFRQLIGSEGLMAPNFRPLQPINDRKIVFYYAGTMNKYKPT